MKNQRHSNLELLRIISIWFLIFYHFCYYGGFTFDAGDLSLQRFLVQFVEVSGKAFVNVFVLISGYFLVEAKEWNWKKLVRLMGQILFYSITIYALYLILGGGTLSLKGLILAVLPVTFGHWWFVSAYVVLYLCFPYINVLLRNLDKKGYQKLLLLLFVIWCVIPTFTTRSYQSNDFLWFAFLYAIAGYLRLHGVKERAGRTYLLWAVATLGLLWGSVVVLDALGTKVPILAEKATYFGGMQKIPTLILSLFIFMAFKEMKMGSCTWVNQVATTTFGIYLIHEHYIVRSLLWGRLFPGDVYADRPWMLLYGIAVATLVFLVCMGIEWIRKAITVALFCSFRYNKRGILTKKEKNQ